MMSCIKEKQYLVNLSRLPVILSSKEECLKDYKKLKVFYLVANLRKKLLKKLIRTIKNHLIRNLESLLK